MGKILTPNVAPQQTGPRHIILTRPKTSPTSITSGMAGHDLRQIADDFAASPSAAVTNGRHAFLGVRALACAESLREDAGIAQAVSWEPIHDTV